MALALVGSADINPIDLAIGWQTVTIAGNIVSPGAIAVDGIRGFERETGWDVKEGKGTAGATLTLKGLPPVKGSIEFLLWLPQHFVEWQVFRVFLKYVPGKRDAQAFDIYHPSLADIGVKSCVTEKISPITHKGRGLYSCTVDFIEFVPPPPVSIAKTPARSKAESTEDKAGDPALAIDPAQERLLTDLLGQAAKP